MIIWQIGFPFLYYGLISVILRLNERSANLTRHFSARLPLDDSLPFRPGLSPVYFSAYGLGVAGYLAAFDRPELPRVIIGYIVIFMVSVGFYWLLPSQIARADPGVHDFPRAHWLDSFQRVAKPYNNFPSMHIAFCTYSTLIVLRYFTPVWLGWLLLFWLGAVMIATLLTKQHYLLDELAGTALALCVAVGIILVP